MPRHKEAYYVPAKRHNPKISTDLFSPVCCPEPYAITLLRTAACNLSIFHWRHLVAYLFLSVKSTESLPQKLHQWKPTHRTRIPLHSKTRFGLPWDNEPYFSIIWSTRWRLSNTDLTTVFQLHRSYSVERQDDEMQSIPKEVFVTRFKLLS
jgi:hypothetical protein